MGAITKKSVTPQRSAGAAATLTPLAAYMREVSRSRVLTAEEERVVATRIQGLHVGAWRAIFSYPPFIEGLAVHLSEVIAKRDDEATAFGLKTLKELKTAARAYRDRETRVNQDRYREGRDAVAKVFATLDVDGDHGARVAKSLHAVATGDRSEVCFSYTAPPRKSRPFAGYLERVDAAQMVLRRAKNRFIRANLRLVISIANRFDYGALPLQDLIQEGNVGLMKAVDRFDVERGFRFSTYASWWIRHGINRAIANKGRTVRLPAHVTADQQKIARARRDFELKNGSRPSIEQLVKLTGLNETRITKLIKIPLEPAVSLDLQIGDSDNRSLLDLFADESTMAALDAIEQDDVSEVLRSLLDELSPIEHDILSRRFGLDDDDSMTLRELGTVHSLSRERIRQLQERALATLRSGFKQRDIL